MEKEITLQQLATKTDNLSETVGNLSKTVDNLAQIVKNGFEQIDSKFEQVDDRFDQIDGKFKQVDDRFDQLARATAKGFEEVHKKIDRQHNEVMFEIHDLQATKSNCVTKFELKHLTKRVEALETKIKP